MGSRMGVDGVVAANGRSRVGHGPDRLVDRWRAHGILLRPGAGPDRLKAFETWHRVRVPEDMRAYFRAADGMAAREADPDDFSFWPLHQVIPATEGAWAGNFVDGERHFLFAAYLLKCYGYAIRLSDRPVDPNPVVIVWGGGIPPTEIAGSFGDFLELYLRRSPRLHGLDRGRSLLAPSVSTFGPPGQV